MRIWSCEAKALLPPMHSDSQLGYMENKYGSYALKDMAFFLLQHECISIQRDGSSCT